MSWVEAPIAARTDWSDGLFSLTLGATLAAFEPGQWINVALDIDGERVKRAYSLASPPGSSPELYLVSVEGGALTPRLERMRIGDAVWLDQAPRGFFTLRHVPEARELWLMSTGTGLAPFMSLVRSAAPWPRFERVVLVHGARLVSHLGYREELEALARARADFRYVPLVTRETHPDFIQGRITAALADGRIEDAAGAVLASERAHVMLCGNPEMIAEMTEQLEQRGMRKHRTRSPGHITTEKYW